MDTIGATGKSACRWSPSTLADEGTCAVVDNIAMRASQTVGLLYAALGWVSAYVDRPEGRTSVPTLDALSTSGSPVEPK